MLFLPYFVEELQNALDEIKKNEKDMGLIAMVANTLFEKNEDLGLKVSENENEMLAMETTK